MNRQVRAHMRFNLEITKEKLPPECESYGSTHEMSVPRAQYMLKNYGGAVPPGGVNGHQRGGCGRERGRDADVDVGVTVLLMNTWEDRFIAVGFNDVDVDAGKVEDNLVQIKNH